MNEPSPNETGAHVVAAPSENVRSTVKPMAAYHAAVAATSGTWIIGTSVLMAGMLPRPARRVRLARRPGIRYRDAPCTGATSPAGSAGGWVRKRRLAVS